MVTYDNNVEIESIKIIKKNKNNEIIEEENVNGD